MGGAGKAAAVTLAWRCPPLFAALPIGFARGDINAFGKTVRARAVTAGGESGNPSSPHFNDQAKRYSTGDLREVYFYRSQLKGHTEREYHPGN